MNKFKKIFISIYLLSIMVVFSLLIYTTPALAGRIEQGFLTISNNFKVTGTSTLSQVVITNGLTITNGNVFLGTNAVVFGTNLLYQYGGNLSGTNGIYWLSNGTNFWILFP